MGKHVEVLGVCESGNETSVSIKCGGNLLISLRIFSLSGRTVFR